MTEDILVPAFKHGNAASNVAILATPKPGEARPDNNLEVAILGAKGSRLLAEVTYGQSRLTCPKCGSPAVGSLANDQGERCGQCAHQFRISKQEEDQVFVVRVSDDSLELLRAEKPVVQEPIEQNEIPEEDRVKVYVPLPEVKKPQLAGNVWHRHAKFESEAGIVTEIWMTVKANPVSKVTILMNKPDSPRSTTVSASVTELSPEPPKESPVAEPVVAEPVNA
jgi:hypothetical protein